MAVHFLSGLTRERFLSDETKLYRFCLLEHALDVVEKQHLWFANPLSWNDPFESRFLNARYAFGGRDDLAHPLRERLLCMCLTGTYSSEAFWKVYTENTSCTCLSVDSEKMCELLEGLRGFDVYIGKADYHLTSSIKKERPAGIDMADMFRGEESQRLEASLRLMLLKRVAFKYENEVRILLVPRKKEQLRSAGQYVPYRFGARELIRRVTTDPRMGPLTHRLVKRHFEGEYGIKTVHSTLYRRNDPETFRLKG